MDHNKIYRVKPREAKEYGKEKRGTKTQSTQ